MRGTVDGTAQFTQPAKPADRYTRRSARSLDDLGLAVVHRSALRDELHDPIEVGIGTRELSDDLAAREHDDIIRHRHRLLEVVRDEDNGLTGVPCMPDLSEDLLGLADREGSGRLVEDQAARAIDDGPRNRDGLLFAAGQRRRW